jgi:DNA uptake protein ComE-like DNA-binding protein
VAKEINLATALSDGMKVFIPKRGVETNETEEVEAGQVSINQATQTELESLWGVGAARAQTIIENRPYGRIEELVSRAQLPQTILDKNQGKLRL